MRYRLESRRDKRYPSVMERRTAIETLRRHEAELRGLGVLSLSLFGSAARNEASAQSDVDLAARFVSDFDLFRYGALIERLKAMLARPIDLVSEPVARPAMQAEIDRDRIRVF